MNTDYPSIRGQQLTREEIIAAIRENYTMLLAEINRREAETNDATTCGFPDYEMILNWIDKNGLPPKIS